jgi:hypothetical protein
VNAERLRFRAVATAVVALAAIFALTLALQGEEIVPAGRLVLTMSQSLVLPGWIGLPAVALADVTGDGKLDLLGAALDNPESVTIWPGNGIGGFGSPTSWSVPTSLDDFEVVDVNGDGALDIAIATGNGAISLLLNNGSGGFIASSIDTGPGPSSGKRVIAGDLDGDGDSDLVVTRFVPGDNFTVFINNGDGTFQPGAHDSSAAPGLIGAALGDLNNDGQLDLVFSGDADSGVVSVLLNNGNATFSQNDTYLLPYRRGREITIADLDLDGNLDIIAATQISDVALLFGNGAGVFAPPLFLAASGPGGLTQIDILVVDLNRDGIPDILSTDDQNGEISWFRGLGGNSFAADSRIVSSPTDMDPIRLAVGDLTGNGAMDLAVAHGGTFSFGNSITIFHNFSAAPPAGKIAFSDFQGETTPADTIAFVAITPDFQADSYVQVVLTGGGVTPVPVASANETGTGANYSLTVNFAGSVSESVTLHIWTTESPARALVKLRTDTATLTGLPSGIPSNETGRAAFGATVLSLEFVDAKGRLLGDTVSKTNFGESFAYTIVFHLSETTTRLYHDLGFDTATGSSDFALWIADTYGGAWRPTFHPVRVKALADGGIEVTVIGVTHDLAGGLGHAVSLVGPRANRGCLIERLPFGSLLAPALRALRDFLLTGPLGRFLVWVYYYLGVIP